MIEPDWTWLETILRGIDKDECDHDEGWWETSEGAAFGAAKLAQLKAAIREQMDRPETLMEHLRRIGVGWQTRTLPSGNKIIRIRLDKLSQAENWDPPKRHDEGVIS